MGSSDHNKKLWAVVHQGRWALYEAESANEALITAAREQFRVHLATPDEIEIHKLLAGQKQS